LYAKRPFVKRSLTTTGSNARNVRGLSKLSRSPETKDLSGGPEAVRMGVPGTRPDRVEPDKMKANYEELSIISKFGDPADTNRFDKPISALSDKLHVRK